MPGGRGASRGRARDRGAGAWSPSWRACIARIAAIADVVDTVKEKLPVWKRQTLLMVRQSGSVGVVRWLRACPAALGCARLARRLLGFLKVPATFSRCHKRRLWGRRPAQHRETGGAQRPRRANRQFRTYSARGLDELWVVNPVTWLLLPHGVGPQAGELRRRRRRSASDPCNSSLCGQKGSCGSGRRRSAAFDRSSHRTAWSPTQ